LARATPTETLDELADERGPDIELGRHGRRHELLVAVVEARTDATHFAWLDTAAERVAAQLVMAEPERERRRVEVEQAYRSSHQSATPTVASLALGSQSAAKEWPLGEPVVLRVPLVEQRGEFGLVFAVAH
jgi:hypothetical protein